MYQIQGKRNQLRLSRKWKMHWKEVENISENRVWDAWCQVTHDLNPQNTVEPPRPGESSFKTINQAGQMGLKGTTVIPTASSRPSLRSLECSCSCEPCPQPGTLYYRFVLWMMIGNRRYRFHSSVYIAVLLLGISSPWLPLLKKKIFLRVSSQVKLSFLCLSRKCVTK